MWSSCTSALLKIPSKIEVAMRYKLFVQFSLFTLFPLFTLFTPFTLFTQLTIFLFKVIQFFNPFSWKALSYGHFFHILKFLPYSNADDVVVMIRVIML